MPSPLAFQPPIAIINSQHPTIKANLPASGLQVLDFPFSLGRPAAEDEAVTNEMIDLAIDDTRPYWIARLQFTLSRDGDGIWLIDGSSVHGTSVDGELIGPGTEADRVLLSAGSHEIRLGGLDSPYILDLRVESYGDTAIAA